jgi:hypothetical protein
VEQVIVNNVGPRDSLHNDSTLVTPEDRAVFAALDQEVADFSAMMLEAKAKGVIVADTLRDLGLKYADVVRSEEMSRI